MKLHGFKKILSLLAVVLLSANAFAENITLSSSENYTAQDDTDYTIFITDDIEHGSLIGAENARYLENVKIIAKPDFGYRLSRFIVKDADNNDVTIVGNATFLMPKSDVTVSAVFEQGVHGTTEFKLHGFNSANEDQGEIVIYDGVTTLNLGKKDKYFIEDGNDDSYLYANGQDDATIPYSEGLWTLSRSKVTYFLVDGESGFYDITLTDLGYDRWSVSILKTVAVLDNVPDQTYTGEEIKPEPLVLAGSLNLTKGTDYEYSYTNNVYVGTSATVTVKFKGDYAEFGSVSKSFNITKATPTVEPPTSANPKYAGACVALVTAGSTNFGTMLYRLDDDDYSEEIPCADKGGDYTVYYKVEESDNWYGAAGSVEIQVPVRVDVTVVGDGSVNGYDPDEFYPVGTVLTLIAVPADGYKFLSWNSDVDVPATFEYTVDAEQNSLEATFSNRYIAYTTSDGEIDWPTFSDTYDIKKNMCEDGLCVMFFGEGITEIDAFAFSQHERLTSIEIPSSIETIGDDAFSFTPLIRVDMKSKVPPQLGDWAFDAVPDEFLIHVPHGSADAYRSANGWKDYKDHIVDHDASMLVWNDDAVVPTCSETGWEAGYICNECHKRFADVDGHVEMSPVAALGTTYGAACIYNDDSKAFIDGMSSEFIDRDEADGRKITGDVTISRHFVAKKYSTIVLPFEMRTGDVPGFSFYSFKKVEKVNGVWENVVFGYVDEKQDGDKVIEANTPYIVVADRDMDCMVVKNGVVLDLRTPEPETLLGEEDSDWQFVGTYNYRQWDSDHNVKEIGTTYGFAGAEGDNTEASIGTFGKVKDGAYIYPMRAYLRYVSLPPPRVLFKAAPAYAPVASIDELPESLNVVIRGEEGTTVIGTINTRIGEFRSADNRWFDLNGRYLGNKKPAVKGTYYNNGKKVIVK